MLSRLRQVLSDPINGQTYQSAKPPFFGRATWFEDAAVERGVLGKEQDRGDLEDPQNPPLGPLKSTFLDPFTLPIDTGVCEINVA